MSPSVITLYKSTLRASKSYISLILEKLSSTNSMYDSSWKRNWILMTYGIFIGEIMKII